MAELPTGTVTFLFTDIEGSTELLTSLGDRYPAILERHNQLLREAFERHAGVEVTTGGDAFFVVFTSPTAAVRAAVEGQRALHAERWPEGCILRVRIGLHSGEAIRGGEDYVGLDVHRASRIASAGHGGQILVSDATRALVEQRLPSGARLQDLGAHRLKGLPSAERIFQVTVEDLPSGFPPLMSLGARPNNLPSDVTSFVGREQQIRDIIEWLSSTRLLTLIGPGGTGKTRLAIRVAEEVLADYEHGCWFVPLDALRDPDLVPAAIASALGAKVMGDRPVASVLSAWLADRELLLVVDNFEQISAAAPYLAELLTAGSRVRILATSRMPLHLYGEQQYPVPPLATAGDQATGSAESLAQNEAARLFVERALAVKPDFRVTDANASAVAQICTRLDGLPLAIELAAARVKALSPEQILTRLQRSLSLLASPAQDLPARQRTLLGAIEWSHDLLSRPEQRLFARLSVFSGSFTLEAAEQVCGGDGLVRDVFDGLTVLLDDSLLRREELNAETRFTMLETIREYARERLAETGEFEALARRHASHFFALAADAEKRLTGPDQLEWLDRLERDHDNLRAAFSRQSSVGMLDEALSAAGALWRFWQLRGHFGEARSTLDRLLAQPGGAPQARAKALTAAGGISYWQGDYAAMARDYQKARELYESSGGIPGLAEALYNESYVPLLLEGDVDSARALLTRALDLYRQSGNQLGAAEAEATIGFNYFFQGDPVAAIPSLESAVAAYRAAGATWHLSDNLVGLAQMYAQAGDWGRARAAARESLALAKEMGVELGMAMVFEATGAAATWVGDLERGSRLLAKADEMKERLGGAAPTIMFQTNSLREKAREALGDERYQELLAEGAQLTSAQAIALAEEFEPPPDAPPLPTAKPWGMAGGGQ